MCGIAGLSWEDVATVRVMLSRLEHRGPDGHGIAARDGATLGHRRLAIIDIDGGAQPISCDDGRYVITFNGEIYNHVELRDELLALGRRFSTASDTEVIVQAFAQWGPSAFGRLLGDYALAIHDGVTGALHLARDPLGVKPLYVASTSRGIAFASELKALLAVPEIGTALDPEAVRLFFHHRYVPGERTLLAQVKKLLPGTYGCHSKGEWTTARIWSVEGHRPQTPGDPVTAVHDLLVDSVKRRLMSEVPLGVYLSGGVDSAAIAAITARHAGGVRTFTARFEDDDGDEAKHARLVADAIGAEHHEVMCSERDVGLFPQMVWHLDEPVGDPATLPTFVLSRGAKRHVTVVLAGEGSDEIFAGYDNFKVGIAARRLARAIPARGWLSRVADGLPAGLLRRFARTTLARTDKEGYDELIRLFPAEEMTALGVAEPETRAPSPPARWPLLDRMQYHGLHTWLPDNFLLKADRMTMSSGVEERVPFLDHRLVELAFAIPASARLRGTTGKWVLRQAAKPYLPKVVAQRRKRGFDPPAIRWLRGDLRGLYDRLVAARSHDEYRVPAALECFEALPRSGGGRAGFYAMQKAWSLVVFEAWHAMYVDGVAPSKLGR